MIVYFRSTSCFLALIPEQLYWMRQQGFTPIESLVSRHKNTLQVIHNNAIAKSQLAARQIYNRESRNIARFIKEQLMFERKSREKPTLFGQKPQEKKKTRFGVTLRYEDNQTLELEYEPREDISHRDSSQEYPASTSQNKIASSRETGFKTSKKSFGQSGLKFNLFPPMQDPKLKKALSHLSSNPNKKCMRNHSPELSQRRRQSIRRRVVTQFEEGSPREDSTFPTQPKRIDSYPNQAAIITMSKQKMERFIRNLHRISWMSAYVRNKPEGSESNDEFKQHMRQFQLDKDTAIPESNLNYMIARRYNHLNDYLEDVYDQKKKELAQHQNSVERQKLAEGHEYQLLDSLSKKSILAIINRKGSTQKPANHKVTMMPQQKETQKQKEVHFNLPFAEFISERQTKTSIYRLCSMAHTTCLRIAFSLYDKNHNGKVDQDDLLQAISLSRKMPQLQSDILLIAEAMFTSRRRKKADHSEFVRSGGQKMLPLNYFNDMTASTCIKKEDIDDEDDEQSSPLSSSNRFSLDKFYIFLKERHPQQKLSSMNTEATLNSLTFSAFSRAFKQKRPAIVYDLLQFLFGAQKEDFSEEARRQRSATKEAIKVHAKTQSVQEETLEEKWNERLKNTNQILKKLIIRSQQL